VQERARRAVTWVGHATVLLDVDGNRLLTDPVLRHRIGPLVRTAPAIAVQSLGRVDGVVISHLHADHVDLPSLRLLGPGIPVLVPAGAGEWLRRHGIEDVHELRAGDTSSLAGFEICATPAVHDARRWPLGPRADALGYVIRGSVSAYFAGDTDLFAGMADLHGLVDVALLPIWGWGRAIGPGHLDPERAARAAGLIAPRVAIPIHWGTFKLALPGVHTPDSRPRADEFAALARRHAPEVEVRLLAPGDRLEL
jgi:L-ascorbate metabolism protein UlaG (beta-lactamase superfamily)